MEQLDLDQIWSAFALKLAEVGGELGRSTTHSGRLYAYGNLLQFAEVAPDDVHEGGVALRASADEIWIHPYIVRKTRVNGAIVAQLLEAEPIVPEDGATPESVKQAIAEAVRRCSMEATFRAGIERIKLARGRPGFGPTHAMDLFVHLNDQLASRVLRRILRRFARERDYSAFGLMDAVTSTARDVDDPELRWQLETIGGEIASPPAPKSYVTANLRRRPEFWIAAAGKGR